MSSSISSAVSDTVSPLFLLLSSSSAAAVGAPALPHPPWPLPFVGRLALRFHGLAVSRAASGVSSFIRSAASRRWPISFALSSSNPPSSPPPQLRCPAGDPRLPDGAASERVRSPPFRSTLPRRGIRRSPHLGKGRRWRRLASTSPRGGSSAAAMEPPLVARPGGQRIRAFYGSGGAKSATVTGTAGGRNHIEKRGREPVEGGESSKVLMLGVRAFWEIKSKARYPLRDRSPEKIPRTKPGYVGFVSTGNNCGKTCSRPNYKREGTQSAKANDSLVDA
ncbi:hypothetical protein BHM03_00003563 [Ensete ventricosum]|nr:hypothetical protein BHM03_00003563 [Ensete ventricosum]